ncbi:hypothetical protein [Streptomyces sp. NPDC057910]|uniref:hypothetical protein n=1 Tax=Streptomyces sp. NPDC057910 TaxID=3346278 RepID=UPI0036EDE309
MTSRSIAKVLLASSAVIGITASASPAFAAPSLLAPSVATAPGDDAGQGALASKRYTIKNDTGVWLKIVSAPGEWDLVSGGPPLKEGDVISPGTTGIFELKLRTGADGTSTPRMIELVGWNKQGEIPNSTFKVEMDPRAGMDGGGGIACRAYPEKTRCTGGGYLKQDITLQATPQSSPHPLPEVGPAPYPLPEVPKLAPWALQIKNDTNMDLRIEGATGDWGERPQDTVIKPGFSSIWQSKDWPSGNAVKITGKVAPGKQATYTVGITSKPAKNGIVFTSTCDVQTEVNNKDKATCSGAGEGKNSITLGGKGLPGM